MMKKIFDDIQREIDIHSDEACFMPDDTMVVSEGRLKQILDEAEAKWKAECCEWKYCKGNETSYSHHKTSCGKTLHILMDLKDYHYCQYCGKRIKISEVE